MFAIDDATAAAIRNALSEGGELSAVVEPRRHFPLITDNVAARRCVQAIASWRPLPPKVRRRRGGERWRRPPLRWAPCNPVNATRLCIAQYGPCFTTSSPQNL